MLPHGADKERSVLQCVAVCCSGLQWVAVGCIGCDTAGSVGTISNLLNDATAELYGARIGVGVCQWQKRWPYQ